LTQAQAVGLGNSIVPHCSHAGSLVSVLMFAGTAGWGGMAGAAAAGAAPEVNGAGGRGRGDESPQPARLAPSRHTIAQGIRMGLR
jgi:hypothetical protein